MTQGQNDGAPPNRVVTTGDFSPGVVHGNYNVTQTIVRQYEQARRKTWRKLGEASFPLLRESADSKDQLWRTLSLAAALTFHQRAFTQFTFIVFKNVREAEGSNFPVYTLLTSQFAFCATANKLYEWLMRSLIEWKNSGASAEARAEIENQWQLQHAPVIDWSLTGDVAIATGWNAVQCSCDAATKTCDFSSLKTHSMDPADYPDHLRTTTDLLHYIVSAFNTELWFAGDIGWYEANYSLMKLWVELVDHKAITFSNIRINADDAEEWDYLNGAFDTEVRRFAAQTSAP